MLYASEEISSINISKIIGGWSGVYITGTLLLYEFFIIIIHHLLSYLLKDQFVFKFYQMEGGNNQFKSDKYLEVSSYEESAGLHQNTYKTYVILKQKYEELFKGKDQSQFSGLCINGSNYVLDGVGEYTVNLREISGKNNKIILPFDNLFHMMTWVEQFKSSERIEGFAKFCAVCIKYATTIRHDGREDFFVDLHKFPFPEQSKIIIIIFWIWCFVDLIGWLICTFYCILRFNYGKFSFKNILKLFRVSFWKTVLLLVLIYFCYRILLLFFCKYILPEEQFSEYKFYILRNPFSGEGYALIS